MKFTHHIKRSFCLLIFLAAGLYCCKAQENQLIFRHITTANGLVTNKVTAICQDAEGYLWIGTQTGLQRYDGCRFKTWVADIRDTAALQSDWISSLFEDSKKRLWVGCDHGAPYVLDRSTGKFHNYNLHAVDADKINGVWHFAQDSHGTIWIAGHEGYYKLDTANNQFVKFNEQLGIAPGVKVSYMTVDKNDNLWLCTTEGLKFYNTKEKRLYSKDYNPEHNPLFDLKEGVANIVESGHNLWLSTAFYRLIYRYDLQTRQFHAYSFDKKKASNLSPEIQKESLGEVFVLSNGQVGVAIPGRGVAFYQYETDHFLLVEGDNEHDYTYHINETVAGNVVVAQDKDNNILIGNEYGIQICNPEKLLFHTQLTGTGNREAFPHMPVSDFLEMPDGNILISYYAADGGIVKMDPGFHFMRRYLLHDSKATDNQVWNLFRDDRGTIWAPNQSFNFLNLDPVTEKITVNKDSSFGEAITCIREDQDGTKWFGLWKRGLCEEEPVTHRRHFYTHFLYADTTSIKRVLSILPDDDKIWVGSAQNGLQVFDRISRRFSEAFLPDVSNKGAISNNSVNDIARYNKDTLVLSTEMGINIFDCRQKRFTAITAKDGLPNNLPLAVIPGTGPDIWVICSNGGFCKIDMHTLAVTRYGTDDGIIDNEFNSKFYRLKNGTILAGTASGNIISFDPPAVTKSLPPVKVTITGFSVFGKEVMTGDLIKNNKAIELSFKENSLRIEFSSLQFMSHGLIKYYYKLDGVDKDWIASDKSQAAVYNQLSNGHYVFMVKCANRDGVYCREITKLKITIRPPFSKTWWFVTLCALIILLLAYRIIRWREKNIQAVQLSRMEMLDLNEKFSAAKLEALRSQMNPHFIFNSLNAIQECILTNKVDAAYEYLSKFSRLQRMVLDNSAREFISLSSELEMLNLYLSLESLRFSQSFSYSVNMDDKVDAEEIVLPSMLVQPYVENAIWHGLRNKTGEKVLSVNCREESGLLLVTVEDNGIGREKAEAIRKQKISVAITESKGTLLSAERIRILGLKYKANIRVETVDKKDEAGLAAGTKVTLFIPLHFPTT